MLVVLLLHISSAASAQSTGSSVTPAPPSDPPASAKPADKQAAPDAKALEERLKRMEEAYLRMEQSNQKIRSEYETLRQKFDGLTERLRKEKESTKDPKPASASTRVVSRSAVESRIVREVLGAETALEPLEEVEAQPPMSPRQSRSGADGVVRRGQPGTDLVPLPDDSQPLSPPPSAGDTTRSRMDRIGAGADGTGGRTSPDQQPAIGARGTDRRMLPQAATAAGDTAKKHTAGVRFGEGLEFNSDDGEFSLQFHNLTQVEYRGFPPPNQGYLQSQFYIPRQRWYFSGDLTKNIGFYTDINRGYNSLDILDAFLTLRFSDRLRLRMGRMKTPYLYEYFSIAEGDLIAPERSLFAGNLSLNRQIGAMFLGDLFDSRMTYAVGAFNGPRRSFQGFNSAKDLIGYFNTRPFLNTDELKAFKYLNLGGSFDVGYEDNYPPQPIFFQTANDQTTNNTLSLSPTFLALNKNAIELGPRMQWAAHAVWFYKSFFLMAEYGGVRQGYGTINGSSSTPVNFDGYMIHASYFLTGEELTRRVNVVKPRRDFNFDVFKGGAFSPGAIELQARWSTLDIGNNIFTAGFADPNLWSNHASIVDVGANWYLNFYTRVFLDWQHAIFGGPVAMAPGKYASATDLFWLRFQVFF